MEISERKSNPEPSKLTKAIALLLLLGLGYGFYQIIMFLVR